MTDSAPEGHTPLRIAINAQFLPGQGVGGVESVLTGLVHALGELLDGPEEYVVIGPWQQPDWLRQHIGPNQRTTRGPDPNTARPRGLRAGMRALGSRALGPLLGGPAAAGRRWPDVPVSDGFYESLGCQVIHFPYQHYTVCALPSVYNPHDLQHLHYPQFFPPATIAWRETIYPAGCHFAHTVPVASQWVKKDIVEHYAVSPDKVQVIPWAPPTQAQQAPTAPAMAEAKQKYGLPDEFALYPSMTWEHKNHLRLLEALALLRDRDGLRVRLVCTGHQNEFYQRIEERLKSLALADQVRFLGIVPGPELRALYRLAQFVVVPSLFEAASGPLFEAWLEDVPVACSSVTSLPEQAGDAALLFDPLTVESIARAVAAMATGPQRREDLRARGRSRLKDFSWQRTARAYRAVYRRAAGHRLSDEDRSLLSWDWMRDPQRTGKEAP